MYSREATKIIRNGWSHANAARGPVSPRNGGIAGLAPIPPCGEAFPPLGPPPTPTPAPAATVSVIAPGGGVLVVSLCQWHISICIFRVNNSRKREYVYYCKLHE